MTPLQAELHQAHKARQARMTAAAERHAWNAKARLSQIENQPSKAHAKQIAQQIPRAPTTPIWFRVVDDKPIPTMHNIIRAVARYYGRTPNDLRSKSREAKCVRPRMVAVYIARSITELSFPQIGMFLGGRDHTTSLHSFQKIESLIAAGDLELKATIDEIISQFAVPE